jgi:hypothetical protein
MRQATIAIFSLAMILFQAGFSRASILFEGGALAYLYSGPPPDNFTYGTAFTVVDPGVVDPGIEVPEITGSLSVVVASLDVSNTNLLIDFGTGGTFASGSFNGFQLWDVAGTISAIFSVTINASTNMVGFDASRITFDADNIYVNFQGLSYTADTIVSLDVSDGESAVPEPASIAVWSAIACVGSALAYWRLS